MQRFMQRRLAVGCACVCAWFGVTFSGAVAMAGPNPAQKCSAAKIKAARKKANAQLLCYSKATLKGVAVDQSCLTKAGDALSKAFQKAEAKGGCATSNDAGPIETTVDEFVSAIATALPAEPSPTPTRTSTFAGTPPTETPSPTVTETATPTEVQSPLAGTATPSLTPSTTPTVTITPTATQTSTPGPNDCCQAGPFCGPPNGGDCPGAVAVFGASCSGTSGQCETFTPAPTTPTATATETATGSQTPTATETEVPVTETETATATPTETQMP
jgi:hypothetical protein